MKTGTRSVPLDTLSVSQDRKRILISTHRQEIVVNVGPEGCLGRDIRFTFDELFKLLSDTPDPKRGD